MTELFPGKCIFKPFSDTYNYLNGDLRRILHKMSGDLRGFCHIMNGDSSNGFPDIKIQQRFYEN